MPELSIRKQIWDELVSVAAKQQIKPQTLANQVLREYVRQFNDAELLARSAKDARGASFRIQDTEEVIRRYRRNK